MADRGAHARGNAAGASTLDPRFVFRKGGCSTQQDEALNTELKSKLTALHEAWLAPPSAYGKNMAAAEWRAGRGLAEVMVPRGKMLTEMGFTQAGTVWLQPEEALFLVESARLVLLHHGRKLSMQETHAAMAATGTRTELYQVYAHLRRLGFIVKRHRAPWVMGKPGGVSEVDGPDDHRDALCPHAGCVCTACMPLKSKTRHERHLTDLVQPPPAAAAQAAQAEATAYTAAAADATDAATERWFGSKRRRTGEHGSEQATATAAAAAAAPFPTVMDSGEAAGQVPPIVGTWSGSACVGEAPQERSWWPYVDVEDNPTRPRATAAVPMPESSTHSADRLQPVLDVYSPNNEFSRRCPDVIQFSLCICTGATPPPFAALVQLAGAVPHPVKLCNVTDGIVTLLGLDPVQV